MSDFFVEMLMVLGKVSAHLSFGETLLFNDCCPYLARPPCPCFPSRQ